MIETARLSVAQLVGERWQCVGRACDLGWLHFGALREVADRRGGTREVGEYALHVQCPWRVLQHDQLVTGSTDVFHPRPGWTGDGEFDWDVQGANRFDVRAGRLTELLAADPVVVTSVDVTSWGDLTVSLSYGLRIEVLRLGSSVRTELWRFFRPYRDEEHVVVFEPPPD